MPRLDTLFSFDEPSTIGEFVQEWFCTRPYGRLLWSLPALLAVTPLLFVAVRAPFVTKDRLGRRYFGAAIDAWQADDVDKAQLYFSKAQMLLRDEPSVCYANALVAEQSGDLEAAIAAMRQLAPDDKPGFAPAHLWLAQKLMATGLEDPTRNSIIESHLLNAREQRPDDATSQQMLIALYRHEARYDEAVSLIGDGADTSEPLLMAAAELRQLQGQADVADAYARRVADRMAMLAPDAVYGTDTLEAWIEALLRLRDFTKAQEIVTLAVRRFPDHDAFRQLTAKTCRLWAESIQPSTSEMASFKLHLYEFALRTNPLDLDTLRVIQNMAERARTRHEASRKSFEKLLAAGHATGISHFVLGLIWQQQGNDEQAIFHYSLADRLGLRTAALLSNLSLVLAMEDESNRDQGLDLVTMAVRLDPETPAVREVRAMVLGQLQRWSEVMTELQFAIDRQPERDDLKKALLKAKDQLREDLPSDDRPKEELEPPTNLRKTAETPRE